MNLAFLHGKKFHLAATLVWICLLWPTLTIWQDSILWVGIMSAYANIVGHWSAYQAARAEQNK
jgi:hypothetical protein